MIPLNDEIKRKINLDFLGFLLSEDKAKSSVFDRLFVRLLDVVEGSEENQYISIKYKIRLQEANDDIDL
jgi:hypothetical protein